MTRRGADARARLRRPLPGADRRAARGRADVPEDARRLADERRGRSGPARAERRRRDEGRRRRLRRLRARGARAIRRRRVVRRHRPGLRTPLAFCEIHPPDDFPLLFYREPTAPDLQLARRIWRPSRRGRGAALGDRHRARRGAVALDDARGAAPARASRAHRLDLDYRPMLWREDAAPWYREAAALATVVVGNAEEWAVLGAPPAGLELAVEKLGRDGARAWRDGESVVVPPIAVEVVNGLGAGDAFGGALCHGLLAGWELERSCASRTRPARSSRRGSAAPTTCRPPTRWRRSCARPDEARPGSRQRRARRAPGAECCARSRRARRRGGRDLRHRPAHRGRRVPVGPPVTMGHEVSGVVRGARRRGRRVVARRARRHRDVLLDVRRLRVVQRRAGRTSAASAARSARTSTAASRRGCSCRRANLHRIPDWLDGARRRDDRAARVRAATRCSTRPASARATACSSSARARSACSRRRSRARRGGDVHVRGTPRDAARLATARDARLRDLDDRRRDARGEFDVVVECCGSAAGMAFALESAARGGRYVQIGLAGKPVADPVRPRLLPGADASRRATRRRRRRGAARSS